MPSAILTSVHISPNTSPARGSRGDLEGVQRGSRGGLGGRQSPGPASAPHHTFVWVLARHELCASLWGVYRGSTGGLQGVQRGSRGGPERVQTGSRGGLEGVLRGS
eukprot:1179639-Prorocentrum_minimum.AAC.2